MKLKPRDKLSWQELKIWKYIRKKKKKKFVVLSKNEKKLF